MSTLTYEKGKWNELGKELERVVKENKLKSKTERKSLSVVFKEFADKHNTTPSSAGFYYYNHVKPRITENQKTNDIQESNEIEFQEKKEIIDFDESISNYAKSITTELRDPRNSFKVGDIIEIEVTSIQDFGVFGKTNDGFEGLIHISEITGKQYVDLPEDFFYIGEKVKVKVKRIDSDGKVGFSTRAIGGKERINPAFKDIVNSKIPEVAHHDKEQHIRVEPIKEKIEDKKVIQESEQEVKSAMNPNDRDNIISFIKKYSDNSVSQKALSDIDEIIAEFGVFQTTVSLMEVIRDLDISSFITELAKKKLEGECL